MSEPDPYRPTPGQPNGPGFVPPAEGQPAASPNPYAPVDPALQAPAPQVAQAAPARERVGRGLALAQLAIPLAAGVTALIFRVGFIASISSFVLAGAAALLYAKGSGGVVRKGVPGIIAIILVGTVVSWFAVVATDLALSYPQLTDDQRILYPTRGSFISENLFYGPLLSSYLKELGLFALFAALGTFGVLRRLWQASRRAA